MGHGETSMLESAAYFGHLDYALESVVDTNGSNLAHLPLQENELGSK